MYLTDTNLLIYLLSGDLSVGKFFGNLGHDNFSISIVSRLEVLIGHDKENFTFEELESYLDLFENIVLDKKVVKEAIALAAKSKKKFKFKDLIIAATAKLAQKTLVTADKDFKEIKGLKIKFYKSTK